MLVLLILFCSPITLFSQPKIVRVQPDALAPGMTVAMELLVPAKDTGAFGADGVYLPETKLAYVNPFDSNRAIFGPVCVSWHGRVLQVPVMVPTSASEGEVRFQVLSGNRKSDVTFKIVTPQSIFLNGVGTIDTDKLDSGNTLVVQSLNLSGNAFPLKGLFDFTKADPDSSLEGNPRYHPIFVLAQQTITLSGIELSVSADTLNGGHGGGGGGHGNTGNGGAGYTGGGSDPGFSGGQDTTVNTGSGFNATNGFGGASTTGVRGGATVVGSSSLDQGGGGGTGCPYGSSGGFSTDNDTSLHGGFGGGSGGGEQNNLIYGGGGGGFSFKGEKGAGVGDNGGLSYGGRFLMPMQGGSGGGAGNSALDDADSAGSGGGGGGGIAMIAYDKVELINSSVTAKGANGISGKKQSEAGGGGGSGGGIIIGGRNGILDSNSTIETTGGFGGLGGKTIDSISRGGNGSIGRIQIQGDISDTTHFTGVLSIAPIVQIPVDTLRGHFDTISGLAGSKNDLSDSIRVYYRDHHSGWRWIDTVRFVKNSKLVWQVILPIAHDPQVFITVYEKVNAPQSSFANYEPAWFTSHLSSAIIESHPSPDLVVQSDTLDFGTIRFDTCIRAAFKISNSGGALLTIDSVTISNSKFSITGFPKSIASDNHDSLIITYCPNSIVGCDSATLVIYSNDGSRRVVLLGCGIDKDERVSIVPPILKFGRVHVGDCDTLSVVVKSIGNDVVTINPDKLFKTPYEIISPTAPVQLAKNDSVKITIRFCPTDSGSFRAPFILTHRLDSIVAIGIGTVRILTAPIHITDGSVCRNGCDTIRFVVSSGGNDTVQFTQQPIGGEITLPTLPFIIPPHSDTEIVIRYCSINDDSVATIHFNSTSDSAVTTEISFHVTKIDFATTAGKTSFGPICLSSLDSTDLQFTRVGSDTLQFSDVILATHTVFSMSQVAKKDSLFVHFVYDPVATGNDFDTLRFRVTSGSCDSIITIPLVGKATNGGISLSATSIDFGTVEVDSCREDSITISLPCGAPEDLQLVLPSAPFQLISPADGKISLTDGASQTITFLYCPSLGKKDSISLKLTGTTTDTFITLVGVGHSQVPEPFIRFHLETVVNVSTDNEFSYQISVDSIANADLIRSITAEVGYDPFILQARSIKPSIPSQWVQLSGSESIPGTFAFSASGSTSLVKGPFALLTIKPFFGSASSSVVTLSKVLTTPVQSIVGSDKGLVTVTTCPDPPGSKIVAGDYHFDGILSNPVSSLLSFDATFGAAGPLAIKVYNVMGSLALESLVENQTSGKHHFTIDVSTLSAGAYKLELGSLGWLGGSSFIIQH
ncbi:MAG TPA: choice-of-anchor D domain-containing protein [Candidatus Kapabacteria bacterium]|nr:choice-of-anchor D domain-containing protein [Candidatus Kapabacteria bacterium]